MLSSLLLHCPPVSRTSPLLYTVGEIRLFKIYDASMEIYLLTFYDL